MSGVNRLINNTVGASAVQSALRKGVVDPKTKIALKKSKAKR